MGNGTDIGRARGYGSAKSGVGHWWAQRVTAAANLALMAWFIVSLLRLPSLDYVTVSVWLHQPIVALPMLLFIASVFYHFRLGVQVLIEDYLHGDGPKLGAIMALNFYTVAMAAAAGFGVLKLAFGAARG